MNKNIRNPMRFKGYFNYEDVSALLTRNSKHRLKLVRHLMSIWLSIGGRTRSSVYTCTSVMINRIYIIRKHQGLKGVTNYLKVNGVVLQQYLGGHVEKDLTLLKVRVSRTRKGLPRIIPILWRQRLMNDPMLIRYILSIFALFRVLVYASPVNLATIIKPGSYTLEWLKPSYVGKFFKAIKLFKIVPRAFGDRFVTTERSKIFPILTSISLVPEPYERNGNSKIFPILTKGPTTVLPHEWSSAQSSVKRAAALITRDTELWTSLQALALRINGEAANLLNNLYSIAGEDPKLPLPAEYQSLTLGKLGLKQEPAGKMRVFAMVDPFTQWVLNPLHKFIFKLLRRLPMDGTFNQSKPLMRMNKFKQLYSLDLTAATDRLPVAIQEMLIDYIIPGYAKHWSNVLVNRDYKVPKLKTTVRYAVGQPMGALSSWAMLALTHHFIVQMAAWRSGLVPEGTLFKDYALLGDDIVIGNRKVMIAYLSILENIGVECGLHKSIISHSGTALEFAKQTWYKNQNVSPISLRELSGALYSISNLVAYSNKYSISLPRIVKIAGFGYNVLGGLNKPFSKLNQQVRNIILTLLIPTNPNSLENFFGRSSLTKFSLDLSRTETFKLYIIDLLKDLEIRLNNFVTEVESGKYRGMCKDWTEPLIDYGDEVAPKQGFTDFTDWLKVKIKQNKTLVQFNLITPPEGMVAYLLNIQELNDVKTSVDTRKSTARFGIEPRNVVLWKKWQKAIKKYPMVTEVLPHEVKESNFVMMPLNVLISVLKQLPKYGLKSFSLLRNPMFKIFGTILPLGIFFIEFSTVVVSFIMVIGSILLIFFPEFGLMILGFFLSILGLEWYTFFLSGVNLTLGFEYGKTSLEWILYSPWCLVKFCSSIIWYFNYLIWMGMTSIFGFVGSLAFIKIWSLWTYISTDAPTLVGTFAFLGEQTAWSIAYLTAIGKHFLWLPISRLLETGSLVSSFFGLLPSIKEIFGFILSINSIPFLLLKMMGDSLLEFHSNIVSGVLERALGMDHILARPYLEPIFGRLVLASNGVDAFIRLILHGIGHTDNFIARIGLNTIEWIIKILFGL